MLIIFNGKNMQTQEGLGLLDFLKQNLIDTAAPGIAVALNECVILRTRWHLIFLKQGDRIEVIHAVQGG